MAESYPAFHGGQKVSGSLLASMLPQAARKGSNTDRTSETLALDPELSFEVEADAVYRFKGIVYVSSNAAGGGAPNDPDDDIVLSWESPSGATGSWGGIGPVVNATSNTNTNVRIIGNDQISDSRQYGTFNGGAGSPTAIPLWGLLITDSTAGTFGLTWSRGPTGTTAEEITMYSDSFLTIQRIA